ncbi:MAG: S26 family signal peptidase [Leptospiraceae bacterium]|nr:S26 family signal peptidase [Leptospiraceae bacterium]MDW8306128.1 S26 family signal peptidase [Leptospiraceae bacterium]
MGKFPVRLFVKITIKIYEILFFLGSQSLLLALGYLVLLIPIPERLLAKRFWYIWEHMALALRRGLFVVSHISFYLIRVHVIASDSMSPTLEAGDVVVFECLSPGLLLPISNFTGGRFYRIFPLRDFQEQDVVLFRLPKTPHYFVKRIQAVLNEKSFLVMGDNWRNSLDSRTFGPVEKTAMLGKMLFRIRK